MRDAISQQLVKYLTDEEKERLAELLEERRPVWEPDPDNKPQCMACVSPADIVGFGGSAGGGKTDLAIGLALTEHQKVGIFRQTGTELTAIVDRIGDVLGTRKGYNGSSNIWKFTRRDGVAVQIELGSFPDPGDELKYQGRPHDLLVFDEAANMRESAVRFLMGWLRSVDPDQRKRVLMCFNPPTKVEGRWVVEFFAPWLDDFHPNPAKSGEIRWFATVAGKNIEVDGPEPFEHEGETIKPTSRTFIASRVTDNKYLHGTNYEATLQAMEEPLRSLMLYGDFSAAVEDDAQQVIPSKWVEAAMARWQPRDVKPPMDSMGVDVAMGGRDQTIIARRHGMWFDEPIVYKGSECTDGPTVAGYIIAAHYDNAPIHVDLFGVGAEPHAHLMHAGVQSVGVTVSRTVESLSNAGLRFKNLRTEIWWRMREALDPEANNGIALPPDKRLKRDLCAPTWELREGGVLYVASRDQIIKKIGRSPDYGSAYVLALMDTMRMAEAVELLRGEGQEYDPFARYGRR